MGNRCSVRGCGEHGIVLHLPFCDEHHEKLAFHGLPEDMFKDVQNFHLKFGLLSYAMPVHLTKRKLIERLQFLQEELDEFMAACGLLSIDHVYLDNGGLQDLEGQADALVDLVYVALGTAVMLGLPWDELWKDVQRANMAKERGVTHRGHQVDVKKPPGWVPPKGKAILIDAGYNEAEDSLPENEKDDVNGAV